MSGLVVRCSSPSCSRVEPIPVVDGVAWPDKIMSGFLRQIGWRETRRDDGERAWLCGRCARE